MITLNIEIDDERIKEVIEQSKDLGKDEKVFKMLSDLMSHKKMVDDMNDLWGSIERDIKQALNDKAKDLLGKDWTALDGQGFSLRRSLTGSVYTLTDPDKVPEELLDVKITVKSKEVDNYIKANSKLPDGLSYNPNRNESIRIKLT